MARGRFLRTSTRWSTARYSWWSIDVRDIGVWVGGASLGWSTRATALFQSEVRTEGSDFMAKVDVRLRRGLRLVFPVARAEGLRWSDLRPRCLAVSRSEDFQVLAKHLLAGGA